MINMEGKLVFGYGGVVDSTPCIYKDYGWYTGTIEEYNIRRTETVELLEELTWRDEINKGEMYGSRMGGGMSGLFEISEEEIQKLRELNAKRKVQREKTEKEEREKSRLDWANRILKEAKTRKAHGSEILSEAAERQWRKNYNDAINEGGEGYVPHRATLEDIAKAEEILKGGC
ncbi:MAG TPA: hypothetical protein PLL21_06355 [Sedimentibacter sp.]|nr:hypothetical protein [Sedimentibacter sp.]